jgi:hypothetical protein
LCSTDASSNSPHAASLLPNVVQRWQPFRRFGFETRQALPVGSAVLLFVLVTDSDEASRVARLSGIDLYKWYCHAEGNELQVLDSIEHDASMQHFSFLYPKYLMEEDGFGNQPTFLLVDAHRFQVITTVRPYLIGALA